jgi:hypothetical protein
LYVKGHGEGQWFIIYRHIFPHSRRKLQNGLDTIFLSVFNPLFRKNKSVLNNWKSLLIVDS